MQKHIKQLPNFQNEDEERAFWATHSSVEYFDWENAVVNPSMPNLKPSTETISLRLPLELLDDIKTEAHRQDVPYQSLIKVKLTEAFGRAI